MKTVRLILGDQLNIKHSWFKSRHPDILYILMEIRQETDYVKHHIQKIIAIFSCIRNFARELEEIGHQVLYISINDPRNTQSLTGNLDWIIRQYSVTELHYQIPDEWRLDQQLKRYCQTSGISCQTSDTEHFLTQRETVSSFFMGKKKLVMERFYRMIRQKNNLLMKDNKPVGGKWNFDSENRASIDPGIHLVRPFLLSNDVSGIHKDILTSGIESFGRVDPRHFIWPTCRKQALEVLNYFIKNLLPYFGTYQDAMSMRSWAIFHSRLSFPLNVKMLHPMEVVRSAINEWESRPREISLPQIEGFVRQIIGWREYMRGVYWARMPAYQSLNFLENRRPLPDFYWTGHTRMNCLRYTIGQSLDYAYAHHIQRLMVTGNFALLSGVDPDQVDAWYLGIYIDAIQWVEITNARGMSQYADGGMVGTKPYVSSSNYIYKMSDYCQTCYYDKTKKFGNRSCPFNSLYWHFYHRHRNKLGNNPRVAVIYRTLSRMEGAARNQILLQAEHYLHHLADL